MKLQLCPLILCLTLLGVQPPALAQTRPSESSHEQIKTGIEQFLYQRQPGDFIQQQIEVGKIDPRLKLAACEQREFFLPPGSREWGKLTVGVRCISPKPWTIYVATTVRVFGDYISTAKALTAGQVISETDLRIIKGELSSLAPGLITHIKQAVGKTLLTSQAAGVSLHQVMFKLIPLIQAGQSVKIFSQGAGFLVTNEGIALNNAAEGQLAKARTNAGQIISGYTTAAGSIEVR